jgi:hypothetical protein
MTTRASLSKAHLGERGEFHPAPPAAPQRSAGSSPRHPPYRLPALSREGFTLSLEARRFILRNEGLTRGAKILIANLELEFRLNQRKISLLKLSNRKYFAVFEVVFSAAKSRQDALRGSGQALAITLTSRRRHRRRSRRPRIRLRQSLSCPSCCAERKPSRCLPAPTSH